MLDQNHEASEEADYILQDRTARHSQPPSQPTPATVPEDARTEAIAEGSATDPVEGNECPVIEPQLLSEPQNSPDAMDFLCSKDWLSDFLIHFMSRPQSIDRQQVPCPNIHTTKEQW